MSFGSIASSFIMFIAVLSMTTGAVVGLKQHFDSTQSSISMEKKRLADEMRTSIKVEVINYVSSSDTLQVYVKNNGKTKLDIGEIDIYVDNERIPRDITNRTIEMIADTEVINIGYWDNSESILIEVSKSLSALDTHEVIVMTEYGVSDDKEFSV